MTFWRYTNQIIIIIIIIIIITNRRLWRLSLDALVRAPVAPNPGDAADF